MTSVEAPIRAFRAPEAYTNIIFRVGGFSDLSVHRDHALQEDINQRHRPGTLVLGDEPDAGRVRRTLA